MTTTSSPPAKTSPAKALQEIALKKISGRLIINDFNNAGICWQVYLGEGKVHYAHSNAGQPERLFYLIQKHDLKLDLLESDWQQGRSDYEYLCAYWRSGRLNLNQLREVLQLLIEEAIVQILKIPAAELQFHKTIGLDPIVLSLPLKEIVHSTSSQITEWTKIRTEINSPLQRLNIGNPQLFAQSLHLKNQTNLAGNFTQYQQSHTQLIEPLKQALSQNWTVYKIASQLKIDLLELGQLLQPLIQQQIVSVHSFNYSPDAAQRQIVACIDDSNTVQRQVKLTLEASGYEVLGLTEPARAMTALARQKPNLILMDINMPEINGYELCQMLRQSDALKEIPIVMLTGRDGLIDRMRAHMVGATEYITKPIQPQELLDVIQKTINAGARG
jgi:twitching motility two-component system response regulator PilG